MYIYVLISGTGGQEKEGGGKGGKGHINDFLNKDRAPSKINSTVGRSSYEKFQEGSLKGLWTLAYPGSISTEAKLLKMSVCANSTNSL